ncbi:MAG: indolepyruvate ferredoxin oxidoreductase family protein [Rhizobiales bacterium]|nr:indolepyruvate ferredoxin oxidoreductase family protein [Hyphomicrobiales bacterium]
MKHDLPNAHVTLDDKYAAESGQVFMSGVQALIRLPMTQIRRDRAAGLNTGGFISGYRGSPLGNYDQQLQKASRWLKDHNITFQPGVNEELAATAVWGSQQLALSPGAEYDGVFGIWYGKGPGVDRSGDVFKHANAAGSSKHGGVLCLAGDDHGAKSSTLPHQSDHAFMSAVMPMLYPSTASEFLELGLAGIAMSRFSGCWIGMKVIADTVETTGVIDLAGEQRQFVAPKDFEMPEGGLNLRWPDDRWQQDARLQAHKAYAAIAWARANRLDRVVMDTKSPRLGIIASGKSYEDVRQALRELDIDGVTADRIGLRIYKVSMPWPLEPDGVRHFAEGLDTVLVVEERREIIENQIKQQLFNWRADVRPRIVGKFDDRDQPVLPLDRELTIGTIVRAICDQLMRFELDEEFKSHLQRRLEWFDGRLALRDKHVSATVRTPYFCAGCPHNSSTKVPEGSRALAGIGCHFMTVWMDRNTETFSHMGGEGVAWTGMAPFTREKHVFANLGDGTYFHSGSLAIRQAVSSGANITYKILYNDAVAMTGGQQVDGTLTPPQITHQLFQEGVKKIYLISDEPERYAKGSLAPGVIVGHRDTLDAAMKDLAGITGCTAIVYDQTCAAEKRRRRKRGLMADPARRVFINAAVCEGCGDCSVQSNCVAVEPLETPLGRKRQINQSACNKDFSCLKGFCPSFVTLEGGDLRKRDAISGVDFSFLPEAKKAPALNRPYNIAVTGVGGTGVLTVGAIIGMAAHLDGKASNVLDMAGLAQKGGAVLSHIRLANKPEEIAAARLTTGSADLLLAADNIVAGTLDSVVLCDKETTAGVINTHLTPTQEFVRNRDFDFREWAVMAKIRDVMSGTPSTHNFTEIAEAACGDAIATNIMMVGFAYQKGLLPVSLEALERAIELNGVAIEFNRNAFRWGRLLAHDPQRLKALVGASLPEHVAIPETLDEVVAHRAEHLTAYQNAALAKRYRAFIARVKDGTLNAGISDTLTLEVARNYAKLLACKDEYEVARLFTTPEFKHQIETTFDGKGRITLHLAPPLFSRLDPATGRPKKSAYGPWVLKVFGILKRFKGLRGTPLDPFGYAHERRRERQLIRDYEKTIRTVLSLVKRETEATAIAIAALPSEIRGFGPIKEKAMREVAVKRDSLIEKLRNPAATEETAHTVIAAE